MEVCKPRRNGTTFSLAAGPYPVQWRYPVAVRIVIAEDNLADLVLVREALKAHHIDFEMTHLKDGAEAVAALCGENATLTRPDVILLDLNMPKIGGLELLAAIRNDGSLNDVPIIVLTSSPAPDEQKAAGRLGVVNYLQKPSDLYAFIHEVGGAIQQAIGGAPKRE